MKNNMKIWKLCLSALACLGLLGCSTIPARSISHSGYQRHDDYGPETGYARPDPAFEYRGELSEFDVLGISRGEMTSEADVQQAIQNSKPVKLHPGASILLIQSGSLFPDPPIVTELNKHFRVVPFTGIPAVRRTGPGALRNDSADAEGFSKSLRLIAARGGADFIMCYWGTLESRNDQLVTKTVSWVPIVHWIVPDEKEHMRIQLKVALVDVRSGNWSVFSPSPFEDAAVSTSPRRNSVDQQQVEKLKKLAYEASVSEIVRAYN